MPEDEDVSDLLDELKREVARQRRADKISAARLERIRGLMVRIRVEDDMRIPDLEEAVDRFWDRATISRKTSDEVAAHKQAARQSS
jgi:hypothetical protein